MSGRTFTVEGIPSGYSADGYPVFDFSDVHMVKNSFDGVKYVRVSGPSKKNKGSVRSAPYSSGEESHPKKKRNGWKILNDAVRERTRKSKGEWKMSTADKTALWRTVKQDMIDSDVKQIVKYITAAVNDYE